MKNKDFMKKFNFLITIVLMVFAKNLFADEVILFPVNSAQATKVTNILNPKSIKNDRRQIDVTQNLASVRLSEFNMDSGVKIIPDEEVRRDISKSYSDQEWYNYYFETEIGVPFSFSFPNLLGPVGLNFGFKPGWRGHFSIISPTQDPKKNNPDKSISTIDAYKLGAINGLKAMTIPGSADSILNSYPEGSEIHFDGMGYISAYTGINLSVPGISANGNITAVIEAQIKKTIKVLENGDKKYIQLRYERSDKNGKGTSFDLGVGITLFETTIPVGTTDFNLSGALKVNLITKNYMKSKKESFLWDFTYDAEHPIAKEALNQALKGNLIPSQELAITRLEDKEYLGIILNEKRTDLILATLNDTKYGFRIHESSLDNTLTDLYARDSLVGFFDISKVRKVEESSTDRTLFYKEAGTKKEFNHVAKDSTHLFFGWINNNKALQIKSKIIDAEIMSENQGIGKIKTYKTSFSYENNHKRGGTKTLNNFLLKASQSLGHNNHPTKTFITNILNGEKCGADSKITVNATFYEEAIKRILQYSEKELWSVFGRYVFEKVPAKLRYEKTRKPMYKTYKAQRDWARSHRKKEYKSIRRIYNWRYKLFSKMKNVNFPAKLAKLKKVHDKEKKLEAFHKLVSEFEMTDDLLHYLLILSQSGFKNADQGKGVFAKFSIRSKTCEFDWFLDNKPNFKVDDLFSDWK